MDLYARKQRVHVHDSVSTYIISSISPSPPQVLSFQSSNRVNRNIHEYNTTPL